MADPVELERRFEELQNRLALTASIRAQLVMICNFISGYQRDASLYESYIRQLSQQIPTIEHPLNIAGTDPGQLERIYNTLDGLVDEYPILSEVISFQDALQTIKVNVCFLYVCLNEFKKATAVLCSHPVGSLAKVGGWSEWTEYLAAKAPDLSPDIELLQNVRKQALEVKDHSVYVPVIEKRSGYLGGDKNYGSRLRRLQVILERSAKEEDDIQLNVATFGVEQDINSYLSKPLAAARNLIYEVIPGLRTHHYRGRISYRSIHSLHEGTSASLAMAGLLYCGMLKASQERVIYKLCDGIAITGDIAENGEIIAVDNDTLDLKVQACFYSWLDVLVVPASQLNEARAAKERLLLQYPSRELTILGAENLPDLFFDRRISEKIRISRVKRAGHKLWKHKVDAIAVLLVMIMAGVIIALVRKPIDKNPAMVEYKGETMFIKNSESQVLWKTRTWKNAHDWVLNTAPLKLTVFFDVNDDGINDIIHIKHSFTNIGKSYLVCYDGSTHKILWTLNKKFDLQYPYKPFIGNDPYICNGMMLDTVSAGPASLYLIETHAKYFPSMLLRIDPRTGKIMDTFVNAGHINSIGFLDINHDGKKEVIISGVNNGYKQAFVAVLPHDNFHSTGPSTKRYTIKNYPIQKDIGYIRIPMTYLGKALSDVATFNTSRNIEQNGAGLIVKVNDANPAIYDTLMSGSHVLFQFDKTMHLTSIGTNNAYDLLARILKKRGKIKEIPPPDYFVRFKDSLLYWNGEGWQHKAYLPFWKEDSVGSVADSSRQ